MVRMVRMVRPLTRRQLMGAGAGLTAGMMLGPGRHVSRAAAQGTQYSGQIVIAEHTDPPDEAKTALTDAYKEHQPNVEIIWESPGFGGAEYTTFLGTQLTADEPRFDIVSGGYFPSYRAYADLNQYRSATNPYTGNRWDQDLDFDFVRAVNALGERIMVATQSVHINWYYNKDLFAQAGVEPPTTWTEFAEVCAKLAEAGITPIVSNFQWQIPQWFAEVYFDQYHTHWVETVRAQPGDWSYDPALDDAFTYDPTNPNLHNTYTYNPQRLYRGIREGELRFDTPEIAALVTNMAAIFPQYATGDFFIIQDTYPPFLQQQAAIMADGTWTLPTLKRDLETLSPERLEELKIEPGSVKTFEWGIFENPAMEGEFVKSPVRSVESAAGEYLSVVNKNQEQTDLTIDFLMFWLSSAGYPAYLDGHVASGEYNPAGPIEVTGVELPAEFAELFDQVTLLGNAEVPYNQTWTSSGDTTIHQDLRGLFQRALEGDLTAEEYGVELQAYFADNLDAILELSGLTQADLDDPARQPGT